MQSLLRGKRWTALAIALIGPLLVYVLNALAENAIGNFASTILFPKIVAILTLTRWPPLLTPGLFLTSCIGIGVCVWIHRTKAKELELLIKQHHEASELSHKTMEERIEKFTKEAENNLEEVTSIYSNLIDLDSITFGWVSLMFQKLEDHKGTFTDDLERYTKKVIEALLGTATLMFHKSVYAGALFRIDDADKKLKIWGHYRMLQEDVDSIAFDMTLPAKVPMGMARAAYYNRKPEVGRIENDGKTWSCTNKHYIKVGTPLGHKNSEPQPPLYASLICMPVMHDHTQEPLGVIAFHSNEPATFDDATINHIVEKITNRIAETLILYDFIKTKTKAQSLI